VHWGIGNALFTYDLSRIEAIEDSTKQDARDKVAQALRARDIVDSLKTTRETVDSLKKAKADIPDSLETKLNGLIADSVQVKADSLKEGKGRHSGFPGNQAERPHRRFGTGQGRFTAQGSRAGARQGRGVARTRGLTACAPTRLPTSRRRCVSR
jgi:hypothetical protein